MKISGFNIITLCIAALALGLASCHETYTGHGTDMSGDDKLKEWGLEDSIPQTNEYKPLIVAISDPSYSSVTTTRGLGAFDSELPDSVIQYQQRNATFHVFAFDAAVSTSFNTTRAQDSTLCLLDNAASHIANAASMMLTFDNNQSFYWPSKEHFRTYDLWAYYTDTTDVEMTRTSDRIVLNFDIDGSQDVLAGKAMLTTKQKNRAEAHQYREKIEANLFSFYTAYHDFIPVVNLKHQLTRLRFNVTGGDEYSNGIIIDSIQVLSPYKCKLTVVSKDDALLGSTFAEETRWLSLRDIDSTAVVAQGEKLALGKSMLLPPADTLCIKINAHKLDENRQAFEAFPQGNITFATMPKGKFKAGNQYDVNLTVFGPQEIVASCVLTGWVKGDDVTINPADDEFQTGN